MYITRTVQESHVQYSKIVLLCFQFCWIDLTWGALLFRSMFAVFSTFIAVVITTSIATHSLLSPSDLKTLGRARKRLGCLLLLSSSQLESLDSERARACLGRFHTAINIIIMQS